LLSGKEFLLNRAFRHCLRPRSLRDEWMFNVSGACRKLRLDRTICFDALATAPYLSSQLFFSNVPGSPAKISQPARSGLA